MEFFWIVLPFITIFLIGRIVYDNYKSKYKEKKASKLRQYWLDSYIRLIFVERVNLRPITGVWLIPLFFSVILGVATFVITLEYLVYPALPLKEMQTENGIIKSVILRKKMQDLLILTTEDGNDKTFVYTAFKGEVNTLANQRVKVWYSRGWNTAFSTGDIIYEITKDKKTVRNFSYSFYKRIEIQNRKERPVHRLYRIKLYKKNKGKK